MANIYAYDAGYADGRQWDRPDKVFKGGWHDATIKAIGVAAFGLRCGLTDKEIFERGRWWDAACGEYDRGCTDGVVTRVG